MGRPRRAFSGTAAPQGYQKAIFTAKLKVPGKTKPCLYDGSVINPCHSAGPYDGFEICSVRKSALSLAFFRRLLLMVGSV